jgi:tRNA(fMet)-specific endonuclease VapC
LTALSDLPEAVLDTDTLSLYRRAHAQVIRHVAAYIRHYGQLTFTELTRYEVLRGLTAARATRQLAAFERFCRLHRILPFNAEAARRSADIWAGLRARGQPIGEVDTMIAGIALAHGVAVVSHNVHHFDRVTGLVVLDWTI